MWVPAVPTPPLQWSFAIPRVLQTAAGGMNLVAAQAPRVKHQECRFGMNQPEDWQACKELLVAGLWRDPVWRAVYDTFQEYHWSLNTFSFAG